MQLSGRATRLTAGSRPLQQRSLCPVRSARCLVARVRADFVKQGSESSAAAKGSSKQQEAVAAAAPAPVAPANGNGAAAAAPQQPLTPQQDALADLQQLRALIDEVRELDTG